MPSGSYVRSEAHKLKLSRAVRGKKNPMYGRKHTEEARKKQSECTKGEKHPCWKGGITPIHWRLRHCKEYFAWRKEVFKRDGHKCVWCGATEQLQSDHIRPFLLFPELRYEVSNGRTLCAPCHRKTDTYGYNPARQREDFQ